LNDEGDDPGCYGSSALNRTQKISGEIWKSAGESGGKTITAAMPPASAIQTTARKSFSQFSARLNLMEYRGIRYTIRAGIERGQWFVVIHPEGVEMSSNKIFEAREDAESHAHRMINRWLELKSGQRTNTQSC
jgi:hypothetical protein